MILLLLLACAPLPSGGDCEVDIDPYTNLEDGMDMNEPCFTVDPATGTDYSGCCPAGYEALGLNAEGEVVCWCGGAE